MCEQSLSEHPFHPLCCQYGEPRPDRILRSNTPCAGSLNKQGTTQTWSAMSELYDWVSNNNEATCKMRCAILDVVSWFPGVLQQLWIDVYVRCPHAERYNLSASKPGVAVRPLVFETYGRHGGEGTKLAALFGGHGGGERAVQPARCRTPAGASAAVCTSSRTLESTGIHSWNVYNSVWRQRQTESGCHSADAKL